jgi:integrase
MTAEETIAQLSETVRLQSVQIERLTSLLAGMSRNSAEPASPTMTIAELVAAFEGAKAAMHPPSLKSLRCKLAPLVRRLGHLPAGELTPKVWAAHRAARAQERLFEGKDRTPSVGTLNLELGCAKALLNWAASSEQQLIPHNPLASAKADRGAKRRERFLTEDEVAGILKVANRTLRAFVLVCVDTGLRHNECRGLRREWIHRDGTIHLPGAVTKSRKPRVVALTPRAAAAIENMPSHNQGFPEIFRRARTGRLYSEKTIRRWFEVACERAGVQAIGGERIVPHTLRHTAATAALRRGVRLNSVQRMLGHSSIAITERYLHLGDGDATETARLMSEGAAREVLNACPVMTPGATDRPGAEA